MSLKFSNSGQFSDVDGQGIPKFRPPQGKKSKKLMVLSSELLT
jgi:hypothetical protein